MLQIKNLYSGYNGLEVLKGIDLQVKNKEIVALIGPNGAGKSTIIKSVFNLTNISGGYIIFNKKSLLGLKTHELIKEGICYVNQGRIIFGNLTVKENIEIGSDKVDKKQKEETYNLVLNKFPSLKDKISDLAFTLSGGQRQILALSRSLMQKPSLLLLDEPSIGLSPILQKELFLIIKRLRDENNVSILIVEQNAKKSIELADRVYLLEDGKIALEGTGKSILKHKKIKKVYLGGRY